MPTTPDEIIAEARLWLGTPFRHDAEVLGAGVDCAHLVNAVFAGKGAIQSFKFPHYHADWWKHTDDPEKHIIENFTKLFREIPEAEAKPADIVVMFIGRAWCHCAIISGKDRAIEAWPTRNKVSEINTREEKLYRNHRKRYFTCA
jgi:NlpC/P60 family putative phage cell wall peptidase